jgi:hypothetical protein
MVSAQLSEINWSEIILDLRRTGMSQQDIARGLNGAASESMIRMYLIGLCAPSHWRGELLLGLWQSATGKAREQAPRTPVAVR